MKIYCSISIGIRIFVLFGVLIGSMSSCSDDDNINFDESRDNIVGDWIVTQDFQEIREDTVYFENTSTFEITFNSDGSGVRELPIGTSEFDWLYQYNPQKVVIIGLSIGGVITSDAQVYGVSENDSEKQVWNLEVLNPSVGIDKYNYMWTMSSK